MRRVPSATEAAAVLDGIASEGRLADAARSLVARVSEAPKRPLELVDAVLAWVVRESSSFTPVPPVPPRLLHAGLGDWALVASAVLPSLAIALG
jgi:hypothetical protein